MNFYTTIEAINARIDVDHPADDDLLAIAEACRWASTDRNDAGDVIPVCDAIAKPTFFSNFGTARIRRMCEHAARDTTSHYPFMRSMRTVMAEQGHLERAQAVGVLNVLIANAKRRAKRTGDLPASLAA